MTEQPRGHLLSSNSFPLYIASFVAAYKERTGQVATLVASSDEASSNLNFHSNLTITGAVFIMHGKAGPPHWTVFSQTDDDISQECQEQSQMPQFYTGSDALIRRTFGNIILCQLLDHLTKQQKITWIPMFLIPLCQVIITGARYYFCP